MSKDKNLLPALFPFDDRLVFSVNQMHRNGTTDEVVAYGIKSNATPIVCNHNGHISFGDTWFEVKFHCKKHPQMQVECSARIGGVSKAVRAVCPLCLQGCGKSSSAYYDTHYTSLEQMEQIATNIFNSPLYNQYNLVRMNDVYVPEAKVIFKEDKATIKTTERLPDDYKVYFDVKKDSSGHRIMMLQIFKDGSSKGAQFFIKPEQGQLSSDHNNPAPGGFITEIAVKFPDRKIVQAFDDKNIAIEES